MPEPIVVCVLRSGGDFAPGHVTRLYHQVRHVSYLHFVVLTDMRPVNPSLDDIEERPLPYRYPGWWSKLELCAPEQDNLGDILYLDLDTTVVGSLDEIAAVNRLTMLQDFLRPRQLGSGVMYLPVWSRQAVWKQWQLCGPEAVIRKWHRRGDQEFLASVWGEAAARWQTLVPEQIVSYKVDVQEHGRVPPKARLVCFHGKPRPWEVSDL